MFSLNNSLERSKLCKALTSWFKFDLNQAGRIERNRISRKEGRISPKKLLKIAKKNNRNIAMILPKYYENIAKKLPKCFDDIIKKNTKMLPKNCQKLPIIAKMF